MADGVYEFSSRFDYAPEEVIVVAWRLIESSQMFTSSRGNNRYFSLSKKFFLDTFRFACKIHIDGKQISIVYFTQGKNFCAWLIAISFLFLLVISESLLDGNYGSLGSAPILYVAGLLIFAVGYDFFTKHILFKNFVKKLEAELTKQPT